MTSNERRAPDARWIIPEWPAPAAVRSLITTRHGGVSRGAFASLNLGAHVGDDAAAVAANRARVVASVGAEPRWMAQVHGTAVIDAAAAADSTPTADAAYARTSAAVCCVMTADCLPVLFCDEAGSVVAAAHAGWRGLLAGVLEETIKAMAVPGRELMAYLGPAIGAQAYEVGDEVRAAYLSRDANAARAFVARAGGKWLADLYALARQRLAAQGVARVFGGEFCTYHDADRFFSYRRDGQTGRMATLIWLAPS
jgi:YfiH family protein